MLNISSFWPLNFVPCHFPFRSCNFFILLTRKSWLCFAVGKKRRNCFAVFIFSPVVSRWSILAVRSARIIIRGWLYWLWKHSTDQGRSREIKWENLLRVCVLARTPYWGRATYNIRIPSSIKFPCGEAKHNDKECLGKSGFTSAAVTAYHWMCSLCASCKSIFVNKILAIFCNLQHRHSFPGRCYTQFSREQSEWNRSLRWRKVWDNSYMRYTYT